MKFLVDECLSPELTKLAHDRGYDESSHVAWLGRTGAKDWELKPFIMAIGRSSLRTRSISAAPLPDPAPAGNRPT